METAPSFEELDMSVQEQLDLKTFQVLFKARMMYLMDADRLMRRASLMSKTSSELYQTSS